MRTNVRSDLGQPIRTGIKRRWDSAGGSNDPQKQRPYQQNSHYSNNSYQPKQFRPNNFEQKPCLTSGTTYPPSYGKYTGYAPLQIPPSLAQYPSAIASAVGNFAANFTFPPPQSSIMPPLPK